MSNVSIQDTVSWEDFATVKNWKKSLRRKSKKKELSKGTWKAAGHYFPGFLKLSGKNPDELIEEVLIDSESGQDRIDAYFELLKHTISHNSARTMCYGTIQGFYSNNKVNTKGWNIPEPHPTQVKDTDDNFPVWKYNEVEDDFELNRILFQDFFNRLNPTYRSIAYALIGTGQDIGIVLKRTVGFVRNQDYRHTRLSLNDNRSKTAEIIDGFYSVEATDAARSIVAAEKKDADDNDPLYTISDSQRKREFRKIHGRKFRGNGVDILPKAKRLEIGAVEIAFRKAQKAMGIKLVKGKQGPLRPKRLRKVFRTAADLAGLGDDKARQLIGQDTGRRSSGVYLETAREIQERQYMKVEKKIWIFKEPELTTKEKEASKELRQQLEIEKQNTTNVLSELQQEKDNQALTLKQLKEDHDAMKIRLDKIDRADVLLKKMVLLDKKLKEALVKNSDDADEILADQMKTEKEYNKVAYDL